VIPRIEPGLNRAVNFARGEGLVEVEKGKNLRLTPSGLGAAKEIDEAKECLEAEKEFLRSVKQYTSEMKIEDLFIWKVSI
jgi:Mn-dependent DtxR family transcriptional regulator